MYIHTHIHTQTEREKEREGQKKLIDKTGMWTSRLCLEQGVECLCERSLIHSMNNCLLRAYYEPTTILDAGVTGVNLTDKNPCLLGMQLLVLLQHICVFKLDSSSSKLEKFPPDVF